MTVQTHQRPYVWKVSSVTCRRSVVSSGYSGFLHQNKLISSSSFHRLDMTLAVAKALNPNKPNQTKLNLLTIWWFFLLSCHTRSVLIWNIYITLQHYSSLSMKLSYIISALGPIIILSYKALWQSNDKICLYSALLWFAYMYLYTIRKYMHVRCIRLYDSSSMSRLCIYLTMVLVLGSSTEHWCHKVMSLGASYSVNCLYATEAREHYRYCYGDPGVRSNRCYCQCGSEASTGQLCLTVATRSMGALAVWVC